MRKRFRQMNVFKLAVLAWAAVAASASFGGETAAAKAIRDLMPRVDQFVQAELERQKIPGVALGIVSGDVVVASKGYGYANVELSVPVTENTIFQSGSVGKMFTGMVAMLEVEDGTIALDDPITKYFPDAPKSWAPITVRQLLNHTSGIADYAEDSATAQLDGKPPYDYRRDYTEDELVRISYRLPLDFPPGTKWNYSNTAYMVLGVLLDKAAGRFYGDILAERVFKPLGMTTARPISEADIVKNRAAGYRLVDGQLKNQEWVSPTFNTTADGALYLSVRDFIAWDRGLRAQALLKPESWAEVYKPAPLADGTTYPYGFGWYVKSWRGKPWYQHSGSWQGFRACISRYLADDLTVIVLANSADASAPHILDGVAALIDPELPKVEKKKN